MFYPASTCDAGGPLEPFGSLWGEKDVVTWHFVASGSRSFEIPSPRLGMDVGLLDGERPASGDDALSRWAGRRGAQKEVERVAQEKSKALKG